MKRRKQLQDFLKQSPAINIKIIAEYTGVNIQTLHKFKNAENPEKYLRDDSAVERIERELMRYGYRKWVNVEEEGLPPSSIFVWALLQKKYVKQLAYCNEEELPDELIGYGEGWYTKEQVRFSDKVEFYMSVEYPPSIPDFYWQKLGVEFKEGGSEKEDLTFEEIEKRIQLK